MFNFSGSEIIFLLVLGLVVLGPEKLPGVLRKAGRLYGEFKRVTSDAQSELRQALADPIREIQGTANEYKGIFTDAAKSVNKEIADTIGEPKFIPHPASIEKSEAIVPSQDADPTDTNTEPEVASLNEIRDEPLAPKESSEPEATP